MYIFTGPTLGQIQEKTKLRTFLNLTFSLPKPNLESTQTQKIPKIELPEQTPNFEHSFTGNGSNLGGQNQEKLNCYEPHIFFQT